MENRGLARDLLGSVGISLIVSYGIDRLFHRDFDWLWLLGLAGSFVIRDLWRAMRRRTQQGEEEPNEELETPR